MILKNYSQLPPEKSIDRIIFYPNPVWGSSYVTDVQAK